MWTGLYPGLYLQEMSEGRQVGDLALAHLTRFIISVNNKRLNLRIFPFGFSRLECRWRRWPLPLRSLFFSRPFFSSWKMSGNCQRWAWPRGGCQGIFFVSIPSAICVIKNEQDVKKRKPIIRLFESSKEKYLKYIYSSVINFKGIKNNIFISKQLLDKLINH